MSNSNGLEQFLGKLQSISPSNKQVQFEKKRLIEKIYCSFPGAFGKYQLLPITSTISDGFPYVFLKNTREINMPRKNLSSDGQETVYYSSIKLLPESAYTIKDPSSGREVSSLTASDEELLRRAYATWEELYQEVDGRNNALDPVISKLIRRKNYTIFHAMATMFWSAGGDMRSPSRQNFCALFIITAKNFLDIVNNSINDTNFLIGQGNPNWIDEIYNRNSTGRTGLVMLSVNKADGPGFNISVNHQIGTGNITGSYVIPEEDLELMQNPVETFLGWQANKDDAQPDHSQKRLFNRPLIEEAIQYMTDQIVRIRMAKQNKTSIQEAISATNEMIIKKQQPTNTRGQQTNDPILAQMAEQAAKNEQAQISNGAYGNTNIPRNPEEIAAKNTNPYTNPPAGHYDPISGSPVGGNNSGATTFTKPDFAKTSAWGSGVSF